VFGYPSSVAAGWTSADGLTEAMLAAGRSQRKHEAEGRPAPSTGRHQVFLKERKKVARIACLVPRRYKY